MARCRRSMSSRPGATTTPSVTTGTPGHDRVPGGDGPAPQPRLDRVGDGAGEGGTVERPHHHVAGGARRQLAQLARPPEARRPAAGGHLEHRAGRRRLGPVAQLGQQHRRAGLQPQRRGVGRRRPVDAETDGDAGGAQVDDRRDARRQDQVRARAVGHAHTGGAEAAAPRRRSASRSAPPTSGRCTSRPARSTRPAGSRTGPARSASSSAFSARWVCRRTSRRSASSTVRVISVGRDREGRARRQRDAHHRARRAVVVAGHLRLALGQDGVVVLHDVVGRQAAVLLRQAHRAPRRVEAHPEVAGRRRSRPTAGRRRRAGWT